ncbi:CRISPR-associated endonuclease Cas1 [Patescibacteria group bacterium]|nr:CRISPR-associated endonuclease Cas1 [Patescibacteria group bacterium]
MSRPISRIYLQALYWQSDKSLQSAKLLIQSKCQNMLKLVNFYLPYRLKESPTLAQKLQKIIFGIKKQNSKLTVADNRRKILLIEAAATRQYWRAIALIIRQPNWQRDYPQAKDPFNQSLNIGYTMLANFIRTAVKNCGLDPSIGILHEPHDKKEALVYDLQELFRQPFIDAAILPIFIRRKTQSVTTKKIIAEISEYRSKCFPYKSGFSNLDEIMKNEINSYLRALKSKQIYIPYQHSWSHTKKKRPKAC